MQDMESMNIVISDGGSKELCQLSPPVGCTTASGG
jgi:hypothetical protein